MSVQQYPHLFEPLIIRNTVFRNRIFASPQGSSYVDCRDFPTPEITGYYERKAMGGAATICMGERAVNLQGLNYGGQMIPVDDHHGTAYFKFLTNAVSRHGTIASIELQHGGCWAKHGADLGAKTYGPVEGEFDGVHVLAMDDEAFAYTIESFAKAAKWAQWAGFGMVTIHGGHGWLIGQFMSPKMNTRTDMWGGKDVENRVRLPREICKAIRKACGPNLVIEMRMSGAECTPDGYDIDDAIEIAKALDGYPDIIHVSAGHGQFDDVFTVTHPGMFQPDGVNVKYAAAIKPHIKQSKVGTVGALSDPDMMEEIIASGKADIVNLARGLCADPDLPLKAMTGKAYEVNKCLRCLHCFSGLMNRGQYSCAINPEIGREYEYATQPREVTVPKKVLVIGGGIGGMQAALTADKRGHDVTLVEKTDRLGGVLLCEANVPFKKHLHEYIENQVRRIGESGVKVLMNTELTPEQAEAMGADVIIAAIGSKAIVPPIPGIDGKNVLAAEYAYVHPDEVGDNVVVLGGGLVGIELAIYLTWLGKHVEIVEMADKLNCGDNFVHEMAVNREIKRIALTTHTSTKAKSIDEAGVLCEGPDGEVRYDADTVICAVGMKGLLEEAKAYSQAAPLFYQIGDCSRATNMYEANRLGFNVAMDIGQRW